MYYRFRISLLMALIAACVLLEPIPSWACGPEFPNRFLLGRDAGALWAPKTGFKQEIERTIPQYSSLFPYMRFPFRDIWAQPVLVGGWELEDTLKETTIPENEQEEILAQYSELRTALSHYAEHAVGFYNKLSRDPEATWESWYEGLPKHYKEKISPPGYFEIPDGLPAEFDLYLRGAILYYKGEWDHAREYWESIFNLPEHQRRYRSTWAAFMMGKTLAYEEPEQAVEWFRKVRTLVEEGHADGLGLASCSMSWEAEVESNRGRYTQAIELYTEYYATGDPYAIHLIRRTVSKAFKAGPSVLADAARNPMVRKIISIYVTSSASSYHETTAEQVRAWLGAVEAADANDMENADLLAWAAYQNGYIDLARRWLNRSPSWSGLAIWLRAKLAMRDGKLHEALELLEEATNAFPPDEQWDPTDGSNFGIGVDIPGVYYCTIVPSDRIQEELAFLQLTMGQYKNSLSSFLGTWHWWDAAFIAECVLTADELKEYVDTEWPDFTPEVDLTLFARHRGLKTTGRKELAYRIRHLLARRLARIGRFDEAREYYPEKLKEPFDAYAGGLRMGNDMALTDEERSQAYWAAAEALRYFGIYLLGTELEPDWSVASGDYELPSVSSLRSAPQHTGIFFSSIQERVRIKQHSLEVEPFKRWHYRYIALDIYWSAIELMPDETDETALRIWEAGNWMKDRDPKAADRFYKALVTRCGSTWLGKEANRLRWFPILDEEELSGAF